MEKPRIFWFRWSSYMKVGIETALKEMGRDYVALDYDPPTPESWEKDEAFLLLCRKKLEAEKCDLAFSVNFHPLLSDLCEELGLPYVSWIYDAPLHIRNYRSLGNSCNKIYHFDRGEAEKLNKEGYKINHLPLASAPSEKKIADNYVYDISMVGRLYQNEFSYYMSALPEYKRGWFEGVLSAQMKVSSCYLIPELLTDEVLSDINEDYRKASKGKASIGKRECAFLLAREVTARERFLALSMLSGAGEVHVFGGGEDERLAKAWFHPYVDYETGMSRVFAASKINLNVTLQCIRTGLPLRIFDIVGCRGFLITNWREELPECFTPMEEVVAYQELGELKELAAFYLSHEEERRRIAENGYQRLIKEHTVRARLEKIL